ncbi:hypothetical protein BJ165DRAFT_1487354 [Panaeolus papilionaceus]|nr:hypothetical protein BJ165DRAFT_1487354 [Panaeolus papilionaceus]
MSFPSYAYFLAITCIIYTCSLGSNPFLYLLLWRRIFVLFTPFQLRSCACHHPRCSPFVFVFLSPLFRFYRYLDTGLVRDLRQGQKLFRLSAMINTRRN